MFCIQALLSTVHCNAVPRLPLRALTRLSPNVLHLIECTAISDLFGKLDKRSVVSYGHSDSLIYDHANLLVSPVLSLVDFASACQLM